MIYNINDTNEWKDIPGYDGKYKISIRGEVYSDYIKSLMNLSDDKHGYKKITLFKDGSKITYKVHRLVAEVFLPNPNNLPIINHKDENKSNNCIDNLEWCTYSYNNTYGIAAQKRSESHKGKPSPRKGCKLTDETKTKIANAHKKPVINNLGDIYESIQAAEKALNIHNIGAVCRGLRKTAGELEWKFYEEKKDE